MFGKILHKKGTSKPQRRALLLAEAEKSTHRADDHDICHKSSRKSGNTGGGFNPSEKH
jgi:hypothetical protein